MNRKSTGRPGASDVRSEGDVRRAADDRTVGHDGYRHEALFWYGLDDFLAATVPFVLDGLEADEAVMAAVAPSHVAPLRDALGPAASGVRLVDMGEMGANPARIIPAWRDFADAHAGRVMRGVGEPIWSGRRADELVECQLHEALLDEALPSHTPFWLLCPYDADALGDAVLAEARRSHGTVDGSPTGLRDGGHPAHLFAAELPSAPASAVVVAFDRAGLADVRRMTEEWAAATGFSAVRVEDLGLAVHEVAVNSVEYGGGRGDLLLWVEPGALVVEVRDAGRIDDLFVGRRVPAWDDDHGRGLWLANQLCDLVQLRSGPTGTTVRIHTWR
ncbi:anti-sigma factor RsbA family regulatory protein [Oryzobacter sp. R7]|uniref:anti-sigma factor RsbA family regulatory protein n=1 Tax=Oryzobacter faecalis TaxID=3388656 RepID=UPI00398CB090